MGFYRDVEGGTNYEQRVWKRWFVEVTWKRGSHVSVQLLNIPSARDLVGDLLAEEVEGYLEEQLPPDA